MKISVVVPVYNAGTKLHKCIKSILGQSFTDFELILVNDGSKDLSLSICEKYQQQDKRVIVINKPNEGSVKARETGIQRSSSNYVTFVDADDWIAPSALETLYTETLLSGADITVCKTTKVLGFVQKEMDNSYFKGDRVYNKAEVMSELVVSYLHGHTFPSSLCAKMYKKELLVDSGNYLKGIKFFGDDLYFNLEVFLKTDKVKVIDKALYFYRAGGFTSKHMPHLFNDMISGYKVQKEVINEHYQDTLQKQYNGISVMLLNTLNTCLYNLFNSPLDSAQIKEKISGYASDSNVIECTYNRYSIEFFSNEFLVAVRNQDIEYLFNSGKRMYRKKLPKRLVTKAASLLL